METASTNSVKNKLVHVRVPDKIYDHFVKESGARSEDLSGTLRRHLYKSIEQNSIEDRLDKIEFSMDKLSSQNEQITSSINSLKNAISSLDDKQGDLNDQALVEREKINSNLRTVCESLNMFREVLKGLAEKNS